MANPAPTINQINAFNATQGTTIDFNIIGGTELVRSNIIYIYDLDDNSLICTHLYVSTESIHELPSNTDASVVYESGKSSADFVNGKQYYAQIQTFTDIGGTEGGSGLSVAKMFWCLDDPTLTIDTIPSTISTTSYNVSATYDANTSVVSNIIQQYQFSLYSATGSLLQSSGVVVGNGEQQGTSTAYDISYNFTGLSVGSSYYVVVDVTTTQGMSVSTQSSTFTVSIDTPTLGEATVVNNACDGYISVTSNLSSEYGGSGSGDIVSFETDSENVFSKLQVTFSPTQSGSGTASPDNVRPIYGVGKVDVNKSGKNLLDISTVTTSNTTNWEVDIENDVLTVKHNNTYTSGVPITKDIELKAGTYCVSYVSSIAIVVDLYVNGSWNKMLHSGDTFTLNNDSTIFISFPNSTATTITYSDVQIELGSTPTTYEPYTETEVSQEFDVSLTKTSTDTDPYLFKAVGDVYGDRLEEDIVGGTVCWNQLVLDANRNFTSGMSDPRPFTLQLRMMASPYTTAFVSNLGLGKGIYTRLFTGIDTQGSGLYLTHNGSNNNIEIWRNLNQQLIVGHKYLFNVNVVNNDTTTVGGLVLEDMMLFDLTQMFGSIIADYIYNLEQSSAGAGVAFMRKYFPDVFTADYDAGTLKSVTPTAHKMVGFNQFDKSKAAIGKYIDADGTEKSYNTLSHTDYIKTVPNTVYYVSDTQVSSYVSMCANYDADKNFIGFSPAINGDGHLRQTFSNTAFIIVNMVTSVVDSLNINLHRNGERDGEYEAYTEHVYPLGDVTLRGIPKLVNNELVYDGDTYESDGTVTRKYGIVDLGTLTWHNITPPNGYKYFYCLVPSMKGGSDVAGTLLGEYTRMSGAPNDGYYSVGWAYLGPTTLCVYDTSYTDATAFKSAMSGVYLVYELATPAIETTDPFTQIQQVSKYGTLEYITTNDVPVGHNTTYYTRDIFGGTDDLVSGQLVATMLMIDPSTLTWTDAGSGDTYRFYTSSLSATIKPTASNADVANIMCSMLSKASYGDVYSHTNDNIISVAPNGYIYAYSSAYANVSSFVSALSGQTLVYELETPLTYQLTPQQIQTLVGVNNVWSEQGDIELAYHIPITNLLVKRQDVDDVSGNWLTLYSQPVEQASDMDFTFIDFLNQYGKTYKYALVPLLTQTQSGVEVEVEGGYTVSDEVQSIFDGVFISDSTGSQKCKANVGYGNVNMNQSVGSITPIGSQYPIIVTNSNNRYHNGSISGMIVPDDYYYNGNLSRIDMVNKRNELEQFLTNKRAKIIKDWNSNIWLVMIMDNIDCSFDNNYGMGIVTFNANWLEIGDPTNQEDLQATGLVDVGGV